MYRVSRAGRPGRRERVQPEGRLGLQYPTGRLAQMLELPGSRQDPYNVKNIFRTFSTGLNGTPMPSFADNTSVDERWDIANYVNSLCEREQEIKAPQGTVTDEIALTFSTSQPLGIDPLTDKPKSNFVVPSKFVEGDLPTDEHDERWNLIPRRWIAMGGQITHKPRNFVNRIDDMWVRALYNETHIEFMFRWDDRTKSIQEDEVDWDPTEVNLEDYGVEEQAPQGTTFEEDPLPSGVDCGQAKRRVCGVQRRSGLPNFPSNGRTTGAQEATVFLGDERFAADITKWTADGTLGVYEGTGWDEDFTEVDFQEEVEVVKAEWANGQWTVIVKRTLEGGLRRSRVPGAGQIHPDGLLCLGRAQRGRGPEDGGVRVLLPGDGTPDSDEHVHLSGADYRRHRDY